jgi:Cu(I)/Ag(I) efflux system membrane fusion protein
VVLDLGDGRFRSQPVMVGIESGDRVEITAGLAAGDRVVASGQFLIDSESNIDGALKRMDDAAPSVDHSDHDMSMDHDMDHPMEHSMDHSEHSSGREQ